MRACVRALAAARVISSKSDSPPPAPVGQVEVGSPTGRPDPPIAGADPAPAEPPISGGSEDAQFGRTEMRA